MPTIICKNCVKRLLLSLGTKMYSLPSLKTTVEAYGLLAKKSLGQNFLLDQNITDKIIRLSLDKQGRADFNGQIITEIGPGPGGLTRAILKQNPKKLTVIEMDDRCIAIMNDLKQVVRDQLEIINADALKTDITEGHIISNLPYNISVPLLLGWLAHITRYQSLTLMFQKEVAERIMAPIRTKDYGRLSILSQLQCQVDKLFDIDPNRFTPAPKIWSTVLLFRPVAHPLSSEQIQKLEKLTAQAFNQRRKMIRQSLKSIPDLEEKCAAIGIEPTFRPEEITPTQFLALAELIN